MTKINLKEHSVLGMLGLYAGILAELRERGVVRSENNPVGDYAEKLAQNILGLQLADGSAKGYDAVSPRGTKYQIKGRRLARQGTASRQLSPLRGLDEKKFDFLVGILFHEDFRVMKGCVVPHSIVCENSRHQAHTNSARFHLADDIWRIDGVEDITGHLLEEEKKWATP